VGFVQPESSVVSSESGPQIEIWPSLEDKKSGREKPQLSSTASDYIITWLKPRTHLETGDLKPGHQYGRSRGCLMFY
jgi:hypothetical protein